MAGFALKRDPLARLHARLDRWCYIGGGGRAPPAPDPAVQTANEAAANRFNVNSPFGNQTWTTGGRQVIGYDSRGNPLYGQQYTQNIELNPSEQRQYDARNAVGEAMLGDAATQAGAGAPGYSARPDMPGLPTNLQGRSDIKPASAPGQFSIDQAAPEAAKAHYARIAEQLQPSFDRQTRGFEQRMSNAGLPVGSEAYNDTFGQLLTEQNRQLGDAAYESAEMAPQLALAERGQQMSDRGQLFGEDLSALQQNFSQDLAKQQDARTGFNQAAGEQSRVFGEDLGRRQQYYNEIASLLGGQQLNPVNGGGGGGNAPVDVGGAFDAYNQGVMNNYNQRQAARNNTVNTIGSIAAAAIPFLLMSDERLKDDIEEIGELPSGENVYEYHYKWEDEDAPKHTGVMAQEIERSNPDAVVTTPSGFKAVNYAAVIAKAMADLPQAA